MKRLTEECERARDELKAVEEQEQRMKKQQIDVKHELEKHEADVTDSDKKVTFWRKKVSENSFIGVCSHVCL